VAQQMARSATVVRSGAAVVSVAVARLVVKSSIREGGVNQEHVRRLMRLGGKWSPILVHETTGVVIDGVHRVAAARLLGLVRIDATLFSGGPDEALIEFVRRNVHHGLPLTLRERKWAAGQVLDAHPHWSDRRIAGICALSPKTVGRLRLVADDCPSEELPQLDTSLRMGRDNRLRPVNSASLRERVAEAIRTQPGASLRSVASSVGVSPETVRSVRMSLSQPTAAERLAPVDSVDHGVIQGVVEDAVPSIAGTPTATLPARGLSLVTTGADVTADFDAWLTRTEVTTPECSQWARTVPASRADAIAAEARRRAGVWLNFARAVDPHAATAT
jgi:ParB-like chromosome segregation protein Spo0J